MALILKAFNSRRYSKWWLASCEVFSTLLCCERIVLLYFKAWKVCVAQVCTPRFERTSRGFVWCTCAQPTTARVPSKTRSLAAARNCFWTDFEVYARHPRYLVSCGSTSKLCTRRLRMALTRQNSIARGPRERSQVLRMSSHAFCRTLHVWTQIPENSTLLHYESLFSKLPNFISGFFSPQCTLSSVFVRHSLAPHWNVTLALITTLMMHLNRDLF